jgi:hypothetical protein
MIFTNHHCAAVAEASEAKGESREKGEPLVYSSSLPSIRILTLSGFAPMAGA